MKNNSYNAKLEETNIKDKNMKIISNNATIFIVLTIMLSLIIRLCVSQFGYSGFLKPPMHGDFEAQRHWMEITSNLSPDKWYVNSTTNNLDYWGLDYPPLTAYHSFICAQFSNLFNNQWMELIKSHGFESAGLKLFMRFTVIISDLVIYFTGVFYFFKDRKNNIHIIASLTTLIYPGLILIDHGHFQYNCVSLGLCLWAMAFIKHDNDLFGAVLFTLSLCFKQMQLYHSLPFFAILFGKCLKKMYTGRNIRSGLIHLLLISLITLATTFIVFMPFLFDPNLFLQVIKRLFPIGRGLFEDKVANVWCTLSIVIKFKEILPIDYLFKICLISTLLSCLPSVLRLISKPTFRQFQYSMVNCSMAFFLFSFQVHEKSILIIALPICSLIIEETFACSWFLIISTFSLFPLFIKDGLVIPYFVLQIQFLLFINIILEKSYQKYSSLIKLMRILSISGAFYLSVMSLIITPPDRLPDLFAVLISTYCCIHFLAFFIYFYWRQFNSNDDKEKMI